MIQSYEQEIRHKRFIARIFWMIVFLFATFLYFFFKGYYPSIDFSMKDFLSGTGKNAPTLDDISIRSFGIVNVNTRNKNAIATLSGADFGSGTNYWNGEKKMVNYGSYSLLVQKQDFLPSTITFTIDKITPFYIDDITLIPQIRYRELTGSSLEHITRLDDGSFISETASGMTAWDASFITGTLIGEKKLRHIGEGNYLSTMKNLVRYDKEQNTWVQETVSLATRKLILGCEDIRSDDGWIWCPSKTSLITNWGTTLTGVTRVGKDFIGIGDAYILDTHASNALGNSITLTGITDTTPLSKFDDIWYMGSSSGQIHSLSKDIPSIDTGLDHVEYIDGDHEFLITIGKKWDKKYLSLWNPKDPERPRLIQFPDRDLTGIKIREIDRNFYIKTSTMLLFLYRGSDDLEWIIDGEIMTVGSDFAFYKKDKNIWRASWRDEERISEMR